MTFSVNLFNEENYNHGAPVVFGSALSAILSEKQGKTFGQDKTVGQMMKTIFRLRSTLPRQKVTYDLDTVLTFMDSLPDNKYLTMNWIQRIFLHSYVSLVDKGPRSYKIGSKKQLDEASCRAVKNTFFILAILKNTKPCRHQDPLRFEDFRSNKKFCIRDCTEKCNRRTSVLRISQSDKPK